MTYLFGHYELDSRRYELRRDGRVIAVEPRVFDLLLYLVEHRERLIGKEELNQRVWDGRLVSDWAMSTCMKIARQAIGDSGKRQDYIRTVPRRGFRFVGTVEVREPSRRAVPPAASDRGADRAGPAQSDKSSIAVLPFENMSGDPEQGYFSDGITGDIITELSRFRSLFVIARHSSFAYRNKAVSLQQIGRELGVQYVLEGSVRKEGNRFRVTAQLVDSVTGYHLWTDSYDRSLADLFTSQDELIRTIVSTVGGRIDVAGKARAAGLDDASLRAYDFYLRAAAAQDGNTKQDYRQAQQYLERAIELDPGLAQAYHHLSLVRYFSWLEHWDDDRDQAFVEAFDAAKRAVMLDDTDSMAQAHLGTLYLFRREFEVARPLFEKAIQLNPNDSRALSLYGLYLTAIGHPDQAIEQFEEAARLNPLAPRWFNRLRGMAYFTARRYDDAISALRAVEVPLNEVRGWLAASYAQAGRLAEARAMLKEFLRVAEQDMAQSPGHQPNAWETYWRGILAYKKQGDFDHLFDGLRKAGLPEQRAGHSDFQL